MHTTEEDRAMIVAEIRAKIGPNSTVIGAMSDKDLFRLFLKMKAQARLVDLGRWLHRDLKLGASENVCRVALARLKPRLRHILIGPAVAPAPTEKSPPPPPARPAIRRGDPTEIEQLKERYGRLINDLLSEAELTGSPDRDLPKHVTSYAALSRATIAVTEAERKAPPKRRSAAGKESLDRAFSKMLEKLQNGGEDMALALEKLLCESEELMEIADLDEETGEVRLRPRTPADIERNRAFGICGGAAIEPREDDGE